jgi:quercetin dioxygenase-like cupin family protein
MLNGLSIIGGAATAPWSNALPHGILPATLKAWLEKRVGAAANAAPHSDARPAMAAPHNGSERMTTLTAGLTKAGTGIDGISWNILGQTYVPKTLSESSFSWHATLPPGTFVPPHIHPSQDEFIYLFEGRLDLVLDGKDFVAQPGDVIRLPMNIPHGIFNKTEQTVKCFFWVSPTRKLYDLFWAIHSMKEQNPPDVVALSARYEVMFLPPPAE